MIQPQTETAFLNRRNQNIKYHFFSFFFVSNPKLLSVPLNSMARHLTRTLTPLALRSVHHSLSSSSSFKFFSTKPQLLEVEVSSDGGEVDLLGLKRLEDAIHTIIVRRLAPDWLPFRPGSSYWVPPKRHTGNILQLVGNLTNPLSHEESLSLSSTRGWPSSSFFTQGMSAHPIPVEVDVQVYVEDSPKKLSGDEE